MIDSIVTMIIQNKKQSSQEDEYNKWIERLDNYKQWLHKHEVHELKAGQKIDVRDTEYVWCVGNVELKITSLTHAPLFYIHYEVILK